MKLATLTGLSTREEEEEGGRADNDMNNNTNEINNTN